MKSSQIIIHFSLLGVICFTLTQAYLTAVPGWVTSNFFRAGNQNVINQLTGSSATPQYTFIFSSPLPGIPKLAYGLKNYIGNDYFGQQTFEIRRVNLTQSSYKVAVQIFGPTNIWKLNVPYIAIDPLFPHHLNSFDNVPVNYNAGPLTNLTSKSTTRLLTYRNVVNYTQQSAGLTYTRFKSPISNNKILFYIMALDIKSTNARSAPYYPIDFHIKLTILTQETYQIYVTLQTNVQIDQLHLSQIMYDQADVQSSQKYYVVTQYYDLPQEGGFIPIPEKFVDNFIMGLTDFSTDKGRAVLNYNWQFQTINGVFGARVNMSIPFAHLSQDALTRQGTMVFYIKTWQCPTGYDFFNLTTNLCQDMCGDYHFQDQSKFQCQYCNYSCLDCTSGHDCLACSGGNDNRVMTGDRACLCIPGYYQQQQQTVCHPCSGLIDHCIDCFYNNTYDPADSSSGAVHFGCFQCQGQTFLEDHRCHNYHQCTSGTFLNKQNNQCIPCSIDGCVTCASLTQCSYCDQPNNKFLNNQTKLCESCMTTFCDVCSSAEQCVQCKDTFILVFNYCVCPAHHYLDIDDQKCLACSPYCKTCSGQTPYDCQSCYYEQNRVLIGSVCVCDSFNYQEPQPGAESHDCIKVNNEKCSRGFIYLRQDNKFIQLCGDGVLVNYQCDDGNIRNGDGCSDSCQIQQNFACTQEIGEVSICKLEGTVVIQQMLIMKQKQSNKLEIVLDLSPSATIYDQYDFTQILQFNGADIEIVQTKFENGKIILIAKYHEDLTGKQVSMNIKPEFYFDPNIQQYPQTIFTTNKATFNLSTPKSINTIEVQPQQQIDGKFKITIANNLKPYYYTEQQYQNYSVSNGLITAGTVLGLLAAFITLFLKNSFSTLIIISALQVTFIGLSTADGLNPISSALINAKPVLGINSAPIPDESEQIASNQINNRIQTMGFTQNFTENFNIMLYCCCGLLCLNLFFYMASLKKISMKIAFKIMQRQTMLFIFFNAPNIFFSLTLLKTVTLIDVIFSIVTILVFGYQSIHFFLKAQQYFGMDQTIDFKKTYFKLFLIVFLCERLILCLLLGLIQDPIYAVVCGTSCQVIFVIFVFILRPFTLFLSNIFIGLAQVFGALFYVAIFAVSDNKQSQKISSIVMVAVFVGISVIAVINLIYCLINDVINSRNKVTNLKINNKV